MADDETLDELINKLRARDLVGADEKQAARTIAHEALLQALIRAEMQRNPGFADEAQNDFDTVLGVIAGFQNLPPDVGKVIAQARIYHRDCLEGEKKRIQGEAPRKATLRRFLQWLERG